MTKSKWWQRLLKVIFFLITLIAAVSSAVLFHESIKEDAKHVYSYSFEPKYETVKGSETKCTYYKYIKEIYCGELNNPSDLLDHYLPHSNDPEKASALREKVDDDYLLASLALDIANNNHGIYYKVNIDYSYVDYLKMVFYPLGATIAWILFGVLFYRTILYVVYDKKFTDISRNKPDSATSVDSDT